MIAACGQLVATTLDEAATVWPAVDRLSEQAAAQRADLLVLPETTYPAYWLESVQHYMHERIERSVQVLDRFSKVARRHGFWLVAGFVEEREGRLYNSAAVFDRSGELITIVRKNFLWDCDNRWFHHGTSIAPVDSEFGRLGVLICADCRAPEVPATLVAQGAEVLLLPTAWVNRTPGTGQYRNVHPEFLIRARVLELGVPMVCSCKSGREGDKLEYVGQSRILAADGALLAEAPPTGETLLVSEVEPRRPRSVDIDPTLVERLMSRTPPARAKSDSKSCTLSMSTPWKNLDSSITAAGGRTRSLRTKDLLSFPEARCAALDGISVVLAAGPAIDEDILRTRATENRIFIVTGVKQADAVVAPDGEIVWRRSADGDSLTIDLGQADLKQFTPETDIWLQRHPQCYRFGELGAAVRG